MKIKKIKNKFFIGLGMILSFPSFSQEISLKDIDRMISKNQLENAAAALSQYRENVNELNDDQKTYLYLLHAQFGVSNYYNSYEADQNKLLAIESLNKVEELEVKNKVSRYSKKAQSIKNELLAHFVNKAIAETHQNEYIKASRTYFDAYQLSKKDTLFLYQAAGLALNGKDESFAIEKYKELVQLNYDGRNKIFVATNTITDEIDTFGKDQKSRDQAVKSGVYTNPQTIEEPSKKFDIYKNLGTLLINQSNFSQGESYILKAYELNPKDLDVVVTIFNMYMQTNRLFKFQEYSIKAVNDFPDNAQLFYNIGVVYYNLGYANWAKENFEKGLALQPEDYHLNKAMGSLLLDKDAEITKKINDLSNTSANRSKKAELQESKKAAYKKILSYFHKAKLAKSDDKELNEIIEELESFLKK